MKKMLIAVAWMMALLLLLSPVKGFAQPQVGLSHCDGYLSLTSAQPEAYVAFPVKREEPSRLNGLRLYLAQGALIESVELVAAKADGQPEVSLSQTISTAMQASETGWVSLSPPQDIVAPRGRSWIVLRFPADAPSAKMSRSTLGFQRGAPATPALCGDGQEDWGALGGIQLAVQPNWEVSAGFTAKWETAENDAQAAKDPVEDRPTVAGFRYLSPNPAGRGGTSFHFTIVEAGAVSLKVYDVRGRLVRTLGPRVMPAGANAVFWDGTGKDGSAVANGVYFARLVAPGVTSLQRVLVLR